MQSCHDYIDAHMPPPPKGLIAMRSFHISPDRGMSIFYFDTNENLNAAFPSMKEFQQNVAAKFDAKADFDVRSAVALRSKTSPNQ